MLPLVSAALLVSLISLTDGIAINNGVVGTPKVTCLEDSIEFNFNTQNPFNGRVFVKGRSGDQMCSSKFSGQQEIGASIVIQLGACGMRRMRSLKPEGMNMLITVVISFHKIFITKVDRAYNIQCLFRPQMKLVTQALDISMIPTTPLSGLGNAVGCTYSIRRNTPDGPPVRYVSVGDKIIHVWQCDASDANDMGMLVHTCQTSDVGGNQLVEIVNEMGCVQDPILLSKVRYETTVLRATASQHAYKYADKSMMLFTCSIQICSRTSGECDKITPPRCNTRQTQTPTRRTYPVQRRPRDAASHPNRTTFDVVGTVTTSTFFATDPTDGSTYNNVDVRSPDIVVFESGVMSGAEISQSNRGSTPQQSFTDTFTPRPATLHQKSLKKTSEQQVSLLKHSSKPNEKRAFEDSAMVDDLIVDFGTQNDDSVKSTVPSSVQEVCVPTSQFAVMVTSTLLSFVLATLIGIISFARILSRMWAQTGRPRVVHHRPLLKQSPFTSSSSAASGGTHDAAYRDALAAYFANMYK